MRRSPGEIPYICGTLAIGVGVVCACWTLINDVLLTPLPFPAPDRLVRVWDATPYGAAAPAPKTLSDRQMRALRDAAGSLQAIALYRTWDGGVSLDPDSRPTQASAASVTGDFFSVLGAPPSDGRTFTRASEAAGSPAEVVVSQRLLTRLGFEAGSERPLFIDGIAYSVIGVMPADFSFPARDIDLWVPVIFPDGVTTETPAPGTPAPPVSYYPAIARTVDGVSNQMVAAELESTLLGSVGIRVGVSSLLDEMVAPVTRQLWTLQWAAAIVLVLACANAAWLFAWRARRHRPTHAVMRMIGASSKHLLASHAGESLLVAGGTVPAGLLVAFLVVRVVIAASAGLLPRAHEVQLTWETVLITAGISLLASTCAAAPATIQLTRSFGKRSLIAVAPAGRGRSRREQVAMAVQVGLVFALCTQAVLLSLSLGQLLDTAVGFEETDLLAARVQLPWGVAQDPSVQAVMLGELARALQSHGVVSASMNTLPLSGYDRLISLRTDPDRQPFTMVGIRLISPTYFGLFGVRPLAGRLLTPDDVGRNRVLVNETLARITFGTADAAVRQPVVLGGIGDPQSDIVGVVPSVRHWSLLREPQPEVYVLYGGAERIDYGRADSFFVATAAERGRETILRTVVSEQIPGAEVVEITHFEDLLWSAAGSQPLVALSTGSLAGVALLLLSAGLHGMMERNLAGRGHEFSVRLALGATPGRIVVHGMGAAVAVYVAGTSVGVAFAYVLANALRSVMPLAPAHASPSPVRVAVVTAFLVGLGVMLASLRSTRRVVRVDPADVLRGV